MTSERPSNSAERPAAGRVIAAVSLPFDPTGVPNLDLVLGGGLRRGSLTLLVGPPGSGKTTVAGQMAFAAARDGRRVLFLTAFSEPVGKLLGNLRAFRFYDESVVGDQLRVHSLQQFLPQGLASTGREVARIVRAERAQLVVLDGFSGLRAVDGPQAVRRFLYDLGTALSIQGATTLITSEGTAHDPVAFGELTTADVILGIAHVRDNVRTARWVEVVKARGSAPLSGLHGVTIGPEGATVHPRIEARVGGSPEGADATPPVSDPGRAPFGLPGLDAILGGGPARDTRTLVVGGPGTGKTMLGLHFALAGVAAGEPTVLVSLRESRRQLVRIGLPFAFAPALRGALVPGGGLTLLRRPAVELDIEPLADDLLATLDRTGARRLVIDSVAEWMRAVGEGSDPRRIPNHLAALVELLHARRMTTLILLEVEGGEPVAIDTLPADAPVSLVDNVVALGTVTERGRTHRVLSLPKLRFAPQDPGRYEFEIAVPAGIRVLGEFRRDASILDAIAEDERRESEENDADGKDRDDGDDGKDGDDGDDGDDGKDGKDGGTATDASGAPDGDGAPGDGSEQDDDGGKDGGGDHERAGSGLVAR